MWGGIERFTFGKTHEDTLHALVVDEQGPGTILHDFAALLDFVREYNLPVTPTGQPQRKMLPQINALLSHPLEMRLKRPQLKSFPHIQGLYLLLRATGLGQISSPQSKQIMSIDQQIYESWSLLNPTEQYFTLLEAWLLHSRPEMVGERERFDPSPRQFGDLTVLLYRTGAEGLPIADNDHTVWLWNYSPGRMGFALLELFGLLTIVPRPPQEGEGWVVDRVYRTPLGEAIFALLDQLFNDWEKWIEAEDAEETLFGELQSIFAPYVPQWQHTLTLPAWTFRPGRYEFKVSLDTGLWRLIAMDGRAPLEDLALAILDAYEFDNDHLYEFIYRNRFGVQASVYHPEMDEGPWTSEVRVGDIPLPVGQSMTYIFDFGDWWQFDVLLEQFDADQKPPRRPTLIDGRGDAPEQYPQWDE